MPRFLARLSASESSHRDLSSAVFIAESDFRYTQVINLKTAKALGDTKASPILPLSSGDFSSLVGQINSSPGTSLAAGR